MDKIIFIPSALIGVLIILVHYCLSLKKGKAFSKAVIAESFLAAGGVVGGALLVLSTFFSSLRIFIEGINETFNLNIGKSLMPFCDSFSRIHNLLSNIDIYILIAGFYVCAVSMGSVLDGFKKRYAKPLEHPSTNKQQ